MNLYHVQDNDRPMWVLANDYGEAVVKWKLRMAQEDQIALNDVADPEGVQFICYADELILPSGDA